jgi:hypothetical protein
MWDVLVRVCGEWEVLPLGLSGEAPLYANTMATDCT